MASNYIIDEGSKIVVCARAGGANTTPLFSAAHFAKQNTKFGGGESEGGAGIHFPLTPFSARPARAVWFSAAPKARHQSSPKKVRAKCIITAPELTFSELIAPLAVRAADGSLRKAKSAFVFAVKSQRSLN